MKNMRFKEGYRVRIKSSDWYNENKHEDGEVVCGEFDFVVPMTKFCGKVVTIHEDVGDGYIMSEDKDAYVWTDEMIEGLVEESDDFEKMYMESEKRYEEEYSKGEYCHEQSFKWGFQEGYDYAHENEKLEINLKNGYEFKDDNGNVINTQKIIMEKKKIEYPKTYEECCKILGFEDTELVFGDDYSVINTPKEQWKRLGLMNQFNKLLICRDVYWKLYGEEIGLGKPWEPSDSDYTTGRYCIFVHRGNIICDTPAQDCVLTFPTPEMRDAFKKNFDPEIEICKEFL